MDHEYFVLYCEGNNEMGDKIIVISKHVLFYSQY